MNNDSLRLLSMTSLWSSVRLVIQDQYFWYLRTQHLVERELKPRSGEDWKTTYYCLLEYKDSYTPFAGTIHCSTAVSVLLELGYNPAIGGSYYIGRSCEHGYVKTVELLLQDGRVDPAADSDYSIRHASRCGQIEVVRLLLEDKRADPSACGNCAIELASKYGHTDVVRLLLEDKRADPSDNNNISILQASGSGHWKIVELLLADKRVDPTAKHSYALSIASERGHTEVIELLLKDGRCNSDILQISRTPREYKLILSVK